MDQRDEAVAEAQAILERVARTKSAITYSDLVRMIKAMSLEPDSQLLGGILDDISRSSDTKRGCMLSAVVIHKDSDDLPGSGFFALATSLGREVPDALAFHSSEIARVHQSFAL
jgi:hypothetical protein